MKKNLFFECIVLAVLISMVSFSMAEGPIKLTKKDKCPVCGMFVAPYPNWVAQVIFADGSYAVFDGCKCMFRFYFDMSRYNKSKTVKDISGIYVTEYYTTKLIDAKELVFVIGSDVMGPMGKEFIPVLNEANAKVFVKDHGGNKTLKFSEITPEDIPD